ncbi:uncharacterized protein LOC124926140 [Impatiens glandulifera]|uniref:uncharacterized protein LOC124926140 n=1 Tax=Impatiens glandulifera TaxID=253017 RepID=UPI001FB12900|nr:uncharacterized protein LOC124926140 [Impatiens glandulifera]XP_047322271.1 uncharacterized protein LOC124926140 [Impatiens glandulifera]
MLLANSFDQWQKDAFFSAAEEIQQSADIMESSYRTWQRMKIGGLAAEGLDELCRELQTSLGTAKWQLDEFERAVRSSYRKLSSDDTAATRHREFINVIENQISRVETALRNFLIEDGKKPLRWIHLDEDDRDDLAAFLSGSLPTSQINPKEGIIVSSSDSVIDIEPEEEEEVFTGTSDDTQLRTWSSPTTGSWKIGVADDERKESPLQSFEVMLIKDKESKPLLSNWLRFRRINNCLNQIHGWRLRELQTIPLSFQFSSARLKFALTLVAFLMVPFILYST